MNLVSVIIVHYKAKNVLFSCLLSLYSMKQKTAFEVIVVDNDVENPIGKELLQKFSKVRYIQSSKNVGFGAGNNMGAKIAKGKYLLFLNSDTIVQDKIIDTLSQFLDTHTKTAIVAPLLLDKNKKIYPLQGTKKLTPFIALFAYSIINKWFPDNPISKKFWMANWNKEKIKEVDVIPGSAFMIRKDVFEKLHGFDEKMFLYFEEYDLCLRVKQLGSTICITPATKLIHLWGESTKYRDDIQKIFNHSRFYYFKKHFGIVSALLTEAVLRLNTEKVFISAIILLAIILRFTHIKTLIPFIAEQGWFYLSAKHMLATGQVPLVGITASHTWLHQGAYWTYIAALCLSLFHFNPVSGAYFTASLDIGTVILLYVTCKKNFSEKVGYIASLLYATSPLVVVYARTAYHTSPIPFFTVLFILLCTYWIKGNTKIIPAIIGVLCILYNFEIATMSLTFVFIGLLLYGFWQKRPWVYIVTRRNILLSIVAYLVTMFPMLLYDTTHQFPQTVKIIVWIVYKVVAGLGIYRIHPQTPVDWLSLLSFLSLEISRLIFMANGIWAVILFLLSFLFLLYRIGLALREKQMNDTYIFLLLLISFPVGILLANGVLSEAYLPVLLPITMLLLAFFFGFLCRTKMTTYIIFVVISIISLTNIYEVITTGYFTSPILHSQGFTVFPLQNEEQIVRKMNVDKKNDPFALNTRGFFPHSIENYVYLAEWMGEPYDSNAKRVYIIQPTTAIPPKGTIIYKSEDITVSY